MLVAIWAHPPRGPAALDDLRCVRARHRARPRRRTPRLPVRRMLLRQADDDAVGHHVYRSVCGNEYGHAAERRAPSDPALRGRGRSHYLDRAVSPRNHAAAAIPDEPSGCTCCSTRSRATSSRSIAAIPRHHRNLFRPRSSSSLLLAPLALAMLIYLRRATAPEPKSGPQGRLNRVARETLTVSPDSEGVRLDLFLVSTVPGHSRSQLQRLIKDGHIQVGGHARLVRINWSRPDRSFAIDIPEPVDAIPAPEALPIRIVYQDSDLVVVDKPAGMVVHPAAGHSDGSARQRASASHRTT